MAMAYNADMTTERPNTVSGLMAKHAEIAGLIETRRKELNRLIADLEAVEHTILLFDPEAELPRARPTPSRDAAMKGEMRRHVLAALRDASGPLTSLEIAQQVVAVRGLASDPATVAMIRKRVGAVLWKLKAKGWAVEVPQAGEYKGWRRA